MYVGEWLKKREKKKEVNFKIQIEIERGKNAG